MTRHLGDKPRSHGSTRMREYLRQERETGLHPAIRALFNRPKSASKSARKVREFARIERGRLA